MDLIVIICFKKVMIIKCLYIIGIYCNYSWDKSDTEKE